MFFSDDVSSNPLPSSALDNFPAGRRTRARKRICLWVALYGLQYLRSVYILSMQLSGGIE